MTDKREAWRVMLAVYLAGVAVALNQAKVPPVMSLLVARLHVDLVTGGWLMSAFAVAGVILGLPAAFVLMRGGAKRTGLIALGCTLVGSSLGALANSAAVLLAGRVIEGVGLALIGVVAPAVISQWFAPRERGTPMGLWASWIPVGTFVIYNLAGQLVAWFGWQGLWWFGTLVSLVAFVVYALIVRSPDQPEAARRSPPPPDDVRGLILNPASWILAFIFALLNFAFNGYGAWLPTYLGQVHGLLPERANFIASLSPLVIIPSTLLAGWLLDRTPNRRLVLSLALLASGILLVWGFALSPASLVPYQLALGAVVGFVPTAVFTLAPETLPAHRVGLALGMIMVAQNLGLLFGPPVVGALVAGGNWAAGTVPLVAAMALAVAASFWFTTRPVAASVPVEVSSPA